MGIVEQYTETLDKNSLRGIFLPDGTELEIDFENPEINLVPGQPIIIEYEDGRQIQLMLQEGMKYEPERFLSNNVDVLDSVERYKDWVEMLKEREGVEELTTKQKQFLASRALMSIRQSELRRGSVIQISNLNPLNGKVTTQASDPIPGFLLNLGTLRCNAVDISQEGVIKSVKIAISPDYGIPMGYDFDRLTSLPSLIAATS
ncbi:MAG: hypothetical protein ABI721_01205 [Candidatus Dojkabacteria bacterium]